MFRQVIASELRVEFPGVPLGDHRSFFTKRSLHQVSQRLTAWKNHFAWSEPRQHGLEIAKMRHCELQLTR